MVPSGACGSCGNVNIAGASYCSKCGNSLAPPVASVSPVQGPATPPPAAPAAQEFPTPPTQPYMPPYAPGAPYAPAYGGYPPGYVLYPPALEHATAGAMIGNTFRTWWKDVVSHLVIFLVLTTITVGLTFGVSFLVLGAAISGLLGGAVPSGVALMAFFGVVFLLTFVNVILGAIFVGTASYIAVRRHRGQPVGLSEAFRHAGKRLDSLVVASLIQGGLPLALLIAPLTLIVVGAGSLTPTDFSGLSLILGACVLLLLLIPVAIFISVKFGLAVPAIVADGKSAMEGLRHSWRLLVGRWWTYFGAIFVVGIIAGAIGGLAAAPTMFVGNVFVSLAGQIIAGTITGSWAIILSSVAYSLITREGSLPLQPMYPMPIPYWQPGMPPPGR